MTDKDDDYKAIPEKKNPEEHHHHDHKHLNPLEQEEQIYAKAYKKLVCVMWVSFFFITCQLTGAIISNSIAVLTDCAHLATDMMSFVMAMVALKMSLKDATKELTFGWARAEVIGTLASMMFLITITLWLLVSAIYRVIEPEEVDAKFMLITAIVSLGFNLVQIKILHQGDIHYHPGGKIGGGCDHDHGDGDHHHEGGGSKTTDEEHGHGHHAHSHASEHKPKSNMNIDAAFLHAVGDMMLTIGVAIAATVIYTCGTGKKDDPFVIADPICTFVFSVIVFFTVTPICKKCVIILMEAAPDTVNVDELVKQIKEIENVQSVHDFHIWQISAGKIALSAHVDSTTPMQSLQKIQELCRVKFSIDLMTIQMEDTSDNNIDNRFACDQQTVKKLDMENI